MNIPKRMKAAVMHGTFDIRMEERPVPDIGPDEVLIKVMAVGVCGSDIHYYEHGKIGPFVVEKPMILGHECAGVVAAVGEAVRSIQPGDRVAVEPGVPCDRCEACKGGRYNLCPDVQFLATPPVDGAFVQYIKHRADYVFPIPDSMNFEEAALIEPFSVGIHAARRAQLSPGSSVAILGMGPVGLMAIVAAKAYGAKEIFASDVIPKRLQAAKALGATHVIDASRADVADEILRATGNRGVDVAFETAGHVKALQDALASLKQGGKLSIVGLPQQENVPLHIPTIGIKEADIYGIFRYANTYPQGIRFLSSGLADVMQLITERFPLEQAKDALEQARTNKAGSLKVMVYPNEM
jgi:L-iditol 2-dehydrogenase